MKLLIFSFTFVLVRKTFYSVCFMIILVGPSVDNSQVGAVNKPQSHFSFTLIFGYYLLHVVGRYWVENFSDSNRFHSWVWVFCITSIAHIQQERLHFRNSEVGWDVLIHPKARPFQKSLLWHHRISTVLGTEDFGFSPWITYCVLGQTAQPCWPLVVWNISKRCLLPYKRVINIKCEKIAENGIA